MKLKENLQKNRNERTALSDSAFNIKVKRRAFKTLERLPRNLGIIDLEY